MKISFANTLSNICESIPGADVDTITGALGADKRISPFYLKGGLSYGGPCFPVDNKAFAAFAQKYGVDALLAKTTDTVNQLQFEHLVELVMSHVHTGNNKVSVIGLAYKPNTPVIEGSPAIKLIENLLKKDIEIVAYDPLAMDNTRTYFDNNVLYASSVKDCFSHSSVSIITTQADEFKLINNSYIINTPTTIIDCWRILDPSKFDERVKYVMMGRS
jgi:UDPglucose 6-dehydrogenase